MTPGTLNHHILRPRESLRYAISHASLLFFVLLRGLYGLAWVMAGITKETDKHWWSEPGVFLKQYLVEALDKPNVTEPYKFFIRTLVMDNVLLFNYAIPVAQVLAGVLIMMGLLTLPMLLMCLFMHINFVLSGNMNEVSLFLYTAAFLLFIGWKKTVSFSVDAVIKNTLARRQSAVHPPSTRAADNAGPTNQEV